MVSPRTWLARAASVAAVIGLLAALPASASAQTSSGQAAAEALFKQGRDLMVAGRYAEACPKLVESQRLDPAPGTLLNLASCYERAGLLASAWVTYKEAASLAQNSDQQDRARLARRKAAELEPRLSTLTIVVPGPSDRPDLQVKRDGEVIGRPGWGSAIPVDPGVHVVEASASGRSAWQGKVPVEGAGTQASIEVPPLEVLPEAPVAAQTTASPISATVTSRSEPPPTLPPPTRSGQRTTAIVVGGVGVAGLVAGAVFGVLAKASNEDAKTHCLVDAACDPQGISSTTSAKHLATYSTIAFVSGAALAGAGIVLYLSAPSNGPRAGGRFGVSPLVGAGAGGVALRGSW